MCWDIYAGQRRPCSFFAGASGAGKTQFLLTLLLSVQLAPPRGLGRTAVYISTEAALSTDRLSQLLAHHPRLTGLDASERPSLDGVRSITVPDIESQDHILQYQLPVSVRRHGVGLVVIDSVAANYRAEFDRRRGESVSMARRANDLMRLGALLRDVARIENVAVVVANQVADRISSDDPVVAAAAAAAAAGATGGMGMGWSTPESSLSLKENMQPGAGQDQVFPADVLGLDHQQRWFTGWGDEQQAPDKAGFGMSPIAAEHLQNLKTPSLGHAWTLQLSARIALVKEERRQAHPSTSVARADAEAGAEAETVQRNETAQWRRRLKVVFCPWARSHAGGRDDGVEFVVGREGIKSVRPVTAAARDEDLPRYSLPTRLNSSPCPSSRSSRLSSSSSSPSSPSPSPPSPRPPRPPSPSPRPAAPAENEAEQREDDDDMQEAEI